MGTGGFLRPKSYDSMETSCKITEDKVLHPFAFRTHTHELGRRVVGYRVRAINGTSQWTLIGEHDPLKPQMFYSVLKDVPITMNDTIAAACKMYNSRQRITYVGPTGEDEMCNFYMMYWVEDGKSALKHNYCFSAGPPFYYWDRELQNIPQREKDRV